MAGLDHDGAGLHPNGGGFGDEARPEAVAADILCSVDPPRLRHRQLHD